MNQNFIKQLRDVAEAVRQEMAQNMPFSQGLDQPLVEAMAYSGLSEGKMVRPFLVVMGGRYYNVDEAKLLRVGAALEFMHINSLMLDDLPCMDNATHRRGKPACHKTFGEAVTILAACSMHSLAFQLLAEKETHPVSAVRVLLVEKLSHAAGVNGIMAGQVKDILSEGKSLSLAQIIDISAQKTGTLFEFACEAGAILAEAPLAEREIFKSYGEKLGIIFQMVDDVLDYEATQDELGKNVAQDHQKTTYPSLMGMTQTKEQINALVADAKKDLNDLSGDITPLTNLLDYVAGRINFLSKQ